MPSTMLKSLASIPAGTLLEIEKLLHPRCRAPYTATSSLLILEYLIPLGNCVHMTPVYQAIKERRPDLRLAVATWGLNLALLRHSPFIDELIPTPNLLSEPRRAIATLRRELKNRKLDPDCALTSVANQRTQIALAAALSTRAWRGGFAVHRNLYQCPLRYDRSLSLIDNNLRLLELLNASSQHLEPRLFCSSADGAMARSLITQAGGDHAPTLLVVACNSGGLPTAWIKERWAATIQHAHQKLGYRILYAGTKQDSGKIEEIRGLAGGIGTSLAGATSLSELTALVAQSDMVISLTTGTFHIARCTGTPTILLGLAWEKPLQWIPNDRPQIRNLRGPDIDSRPENYCMEEISSAWVCRELDEMTMQYPFSLEARQARLEACIHDSDLLDASHN